MLHAQLDLITADGPVLGECLTYLDSMLRPAVESQRDSLGTSLLASPERGAAIFESLWASQGALQVGDRVAAPMRGELARRGSITSEEYQVSTFERVAPLHGSEAVRLTRIDVEPSAADDVIEVFGDTAVPWLAESPGFCGALLFADPASGHLISQTVWQDAQSRKASPSTAAVIRADTLDAANCAIRAVEDYSLVFSSARNA